MLSTVTLVALLLFGNSCTSYNPALYPGYDVLNPSDKDSPMAIVFYEDGKWVVDWDPTFEPDETEVYYVVKQFFLQWNKDLQLAVQRLRR